MRGVTAMRIVLIIANQFTFDTIVSMKAKASRTKKNHSYTAFFEENEHGGYTVTVPVLPGLVTEVNDMKDAKSILKDAITCYIEGLKKARIEIPKEQYAASMRLEVIA